MSSQTPLIQEYFDKMKRYNQGEFSCNEDENQELSSIDLKLHEFRDKLESTKTLLNEPQSPSSKDLFLSISPDMVFIVSRFNALVKSENIKLLRINFLIIVFFFVAFLFFLEATRIILLAALVVVLPAYIIHKLNIVKDNHVKKLDKKCVDYENQIKFLEQEKQKIIQKYRVNKFKKLKELEEQVKKLLSRNEEELIQRGLTKLEISTKDLELEPIKSLYGIKKPEQSNSYVLNSNLHEEVDLTGENLLIRDEDFACQVQGLDKKKRFGVYEFCSILITHNLLAYYKCYWNFVRQYPVDEETGVYLYNEIVSIHTCERSSLTQQDSSELRNYGGWLIINTTDGKNFSMRIYDDKKQKSDFEFGKPSKIDRYTNGIREWLKSTDAK